MTGRFIILSLFALFIIGCDSDIDVFDEGEPMPVVYCILDQDSTTQSLRLSRSFNSYQAAIPPDSPDSLLFDRALDVALERVYNGQVVERAYFIPVDVKKETGFFPVTEHWIYQTDMQILPDTEYRVIVYIDDFDQIVYSVCRTVSPFEIVNPAYPEVRYLHFQVEHNPQFYWTQSNNAGIYQFGFIVHFDEYIEDRVENKTENISLNTAFILESSGHYFSQSINSNKFYIKLAQQLPVDPTIIRKFKSLDAYVLCGGEELAYLVRLQESGQTFSLMEYTNVYNGIGVFSSRLTRYVRGFALTEQTIDSLAYGRYTYDLNFLDRNGIREGGGK